MTITVSCKNCYRDYDYILTTQDYWKCPFCGAKYTNKIKWLEDSVEKLLIDVEKLKKEVEELNKKNPAQD